jgi:hypothetical protein
MLGISHWATRATFGGILAFLAAVASPSSAQADVTKLFDLFGDFANHSTLSGTVSIDTTNGTATAIDAFAGGFEFKIITGQSSQGAEYLVSATTSGDAAQLSLVFSVGSLVGYGGSSLSPDTRLGALSLQGGGANPATSSPVPEPSTWMLMAVGFAGLAFFANRWACSSRPRQRSSTARRARSPSATRRPIRWWRQARFPASRCPAVRQAPPSLAP